MPTKEAQGTSADSDAEALARVRALLDHWEAAAREPGDISTDYDHVSEVLREALCGGPCTCRDVYAGHNLVGKSIDENCRQHGVGTDYYRRKLAYYKERLSEIRSKRKK